MDRNQPDLSLDESIKQVMQTLPPVIRTYLAEGKYTTVAKNLMAKYRLRIDQAGVLEREIMLLLMGIENPDEFTQALVEEAKLDQQTINDITKDVNEQIFIPLREEMRSGGKTQPPARPAAPAAPRAEVPPLRPTFIPANPQMPSRPPETFASVPRYAPPPKAMSPKPVPPPPSPMPTPPPQPKPAEHMPRPDRMLEDHEEPHIEFKKDVPKPAPARTAPPPPNLPGAMPPPKSAPPIPPAPPKPPSPPQKPYSADPYREPID